MKTPVSVCAKVRRVPLVSATFFQIAAGCCSEINHGGGLNFEIQANLGNQAPHPVGVVPLVRREVSVVFTGVPEDSLQTAPVALSGQVVRGFADELGNLGQRLRWVCGEPAGDQSGAWAPLCVNFKTAGLSCDWSAVRRWAPKLSSGPKLPSSSISTSSSHERED